VSLSFLVLAEEPDPSELSIDLASGDHDAEQLAGDVPTAVADLIGG
jgi:hypothetical protein